MFQKITLLTGGSKGIGKRIAINLLKQNHKIINLSRTNSDIIDKNLININLDLKNTNTIKDTMKTINHDYKINNFIHCA